MKNFLLLIIITINSNIYAQRYHIDKTVTYGDTITFLRTTMEPLNGIVFNEFGEIGKYIKGRVNGIYKDWYKTGQLYCKLYMINGINSGEAIYWHENGQVEISGEYSNGQKIGTWNKWDSDGLLTEQKLYESY